MAKIITRRKIGAAIIHSTLIQLGGTMDAPNEHRQIRLEPMILEEPSALKRKAEQMESVKKDSLSQEKESNKKQRSVKEESDKKPTEGEDDTLEITLKLAIIKIERKDILTHSDQSLLTIQRAAEQGHIHCQYLMGKCYYLGHGVEKNLEEAAAWYQKAADQSDKEAQYMMGQCYYYGEGVEKSFEEAVAWFHKAAEQGHKYAHYMMGRCYNRGHGISPDVLEAIRYYILSNTPTANEKLSDILGPLKKEGALNEQQTVEKINHLTELAEYLIAKNGLKAGLNRPGFGIGKIDNPGQAAFHQSLVDFGSAVLKLLKALNVPGFMVKFKKKPEAFIYSPTHKLTVLKIYPTLGTLTCFGEEAVTNGDLLYEILNQGDLSTPQSYHYIHKKIREAIKAENNTIKQFEAEIVKFDKLIQVIKAEIAEDKEIQHQEILQEAERCGIPLRPALRESAQQEIAGATSKRLIHYLSEKVLHQKVLDKCRLSLKFLDRQLAVLEQIKTDLLDLLDGSIHLRNEKLASIRPGLLSK